MIHSLNSRFKTYEAHIQMLIGRSYFVKLGFYVTLLTLSSNVGVLQWASRQDLFMLLSLLLVSWNCNLLGGRWQLWTFPVHLWVSRMSVSGPSSYCAHKDKRWTLGSLQAPESVVWAGLAPLCSQTFENCPSLLLILPTEDTDTKHHTPGVQLKLK